MVERVPLFHLDGEDSTILRGIAILFVLLGHTDYYDWGGAGGVVLFLILSGYGMNLSCRKGGLERYWNKRLRKVYFPYLMVALFVLAGWRIRSKRVILCTLLGLDLGLIADPTMWYISFILLWYLVYYGILRLCRVTRNETVQTVLLLLCLVAASFGFRILSEKGLWHQDSGAWLYVFAFPLGVLLGELTKMKVRENTRTVIQLAILLLTSAYMLGEYGRVKNTTMAMIMGIQPIAIVLAVKIRGRLAAVLSWFGRYSYPIYLMEGIFLPNRNALFARLSCQVLIDLAFFGVSIAAALIFWGAYSKWEKLVPFDRFLRL